MSAVPMKDSGVEWLGDIPSHWEVVPLFALANYVNGAVFKPADWSDEGIPIIRIQNLTGLSDTYNYFRGAKPRHYRVKNGDMLVSWSASIGIFIWQGDEAWLNQHIFKVDNLSERITKEFFHFSLQNTVRALVSQTHGSTMKHIVRSAFLRTKAPLPPLIAQHAIAAHLDRVTPKIDAFIAKTEQLNALLREKRKALISHAVTKGLDPAAPLKNSGVEWLKEIPNHWDVKRIRHVVQTSPKKSELRYTSDELEVSFLPMKAIGADGKLDLTHVTQIADVYEGYTYFCEHDVLIAKITPSFENGKGAIARKLVNGVGFGTTELFVLRPGPDTCSDYMYYLTMSLRFRNIGGHSMQGAAGQKRITELFIKDYKFGLPPLVEQRAIAAYLDRETARIDALIAKNDQLIALLREKRTSLISAAVTGKIDLRNGA